MLRPVILSGGSGTRLWPLSTRSVPKQFVPLLPGGTLFVRALRVLASVPDVGRPIVVTGSAHVELVTKEAAAAEVVPHLVIIEPEGRNTAPAALAAALSVDGDDVLAILPSDHLIREASAFTNVVVESTALAEAGRIVTFGVRPTRPHTGYGYIELGEPLPGGFLVHRFKEKPGPEEAESLYADGNHVWNSGMFVVAAQTLIDEAAVLCPEILSGVRSALGETVDRVMTLGDPFTQVEKVSLDYAIMEKTDKGVVVPIDVGWDDVGSYEALWEISAKDQEGNVVSGDAVLLDVADSIVSATSRTVAVAGIDGVVVVETPEAVLVVPKHMSQVVRDLVARIDPG